MEPDQTTGVRFVNGIPIFAPNSTWSGSGFYISHNAVDVRIYGGETTALVRTAAGEKAFYILLGDHRQQYIALIDDGFEACKAYFDGLPELHHPMSDTPESLEKLRNSLKKLGKSLYK